MCRLDDGVLGQNQNSVLYIIILILGGGGKGND